MQATGAHTGTPDVFISYASPDSAFAETVCEAFEPYILHRPSNVGEIRNGHVVTEVCLRSK